MHGDDDWDVSCYEDHQEILNHVIAGDVLYPDEGEVGFDGVESGKDGLNSRLGDEEIRVGCDDGFVFVIFDCVKFRGIDIAVDEEGFVWVFG